MAPGESIMAPRTDSSASRFCGGTGGAGEGTRGSWTDTTPGWSPLAEEPQRLCKTGRVLLGQLWSEQPLGNVCSQKRRTTLWMRFPLGAGTFEHFPHLVDGVCRDLREEPARELVDAHDLVSLRVL